VLGAQRPAVFAILFEAARAAGVAMETGRTVIGVEPFAAGGRRLLFEDG